MKSSPSTTVAVAHDTQLAKLARRGTASVAGAAFSALFGVLLVVIVTNGFSPTLAGTLFSATSVFLILESVALLGTDTGLVKWLPAQLASGRAADLTRTLVISAVPVLALSATVAVALYAAAPALSPHLVGSDAASMMAVMLRALAIVLPVAALYDLVVAATRGTGSMKPTVVVDNIGRLGLQALAVLVVLLAGGGPLALALAWSLPYLLGLVAAGTWLWSRVRRQTDRGRRGRGHRVVRPDTRVLGLHRAAGDRAGHPDRAQTLRHRDGGGARLAGRCRAVHRSDPVHRPRAAVRAVRPAGVVPSAQLAVRQGRDGGRALRSSRPPPSGA